ncbi:Cytochrome c oxidase assembly protein cox18 [Mactra antiquata]
MSRQIISNIQLLNRSSKCLSYLNVSKITTCGCGGDLITKRHFSAFRKYDSDNLLRKKSHRTFLTRKIERNFGTNVFGNFIEICEAQFVLLHEFTGLPWWATIVICTVPLRITMSYMMYKYGIKMKYKKYHVDSVLIPKYLQDVKIKLRQPEYRHFNKNMREQYLKAQAYHAAKSLYKEHKVNQYTVIMLALSPIIVWISYSTALWNLCGVERTYLYFLSQSSSLAISPDLHYEGLLWFKDFAAIDPYHILPVLTGLFFAASSEALVFYWCTSGFVGLVCKLLMMHPDFERRCIPDDEHYIEDNNRIDNIRKNMKTRYNPSYWFLK